MPRPDSQVIHPDLLATAQAWSGRSRIDTCTITRPGVSTWDPETNSSSDGTTTVYDGPIRMQDVQPFGGSRTTGFGGQAVTTSSYFAVIDADAAEIRIEDIVTFTDSADPDLIGRSLRVTEVLVDTFHTHRRLVLEEAATPAGD